jgi:predicted amidohydrolase YtcJ
MTTTLFVNGVIRTNESGPQGEPERVPRWVMVEDHRTAGVWPSWDDAPEDPASIGNWQSDDLPTADRTIDLHGGTLMPAFCDAHVHLPATGLALAGMSFRGVRSAAEILSAFSERARGGAILFGSGFEDPLDEPLTRAELDAAVGERPAMLARADLHSCVVSTALLDRLDLTSISDGADRNDEGAPTGYLRERAASAAWRWFEDNLPRDQNVEAIRRATRLAYSKGVATVHEMFVVEWKGWHAYDVFREALEGVALNVVVYLGTDDVGKVAALGHDRIGGDYFLDGSFGSHTAWMNEPFSSPPPTGSPAAGISYREDDDLFAFFSEAQRSGMQVGVHAIGDAAIEQAIGTWERVASDFGAAAVRSLMHRIEHFECASDDHIERAAKLGLAASVQPAFDAFWGGADGLYSERIGWDRARLMNRFRTMNDAGLLLAAGSDSTVTPLDPFLQMKALRNHHVPEERVEGDHAVGMNTLGGHLLGGMDRDHGTIAAGGAADLVWLDRDPAGIDADELDKVEVLGTWIAGKRVFPFEEAEAE